MQTFNKATTAAQRSQLPFTPFNTQGDTLGASSSNSSFEGFFYRADIWLDKNLNPIAKNLLMEIYLLEQQPLGCIASNTHLAKTLNIGKRSVERYIADLLKSGHLTLLSFNGHHRKLRVNLGRLEPRQIGEEGRQIVPEPRQNGELTSPKWRQSTVKEKNQLEESVDRDSAAQKISSLDKKEKSKTSPKSRKRKSQKEKEKQPSQENKEEVVKLPFESEKFRKKWEEWTQYRKEIKCPYRSNLSIKQVFARLAKFEEAFVIELIEESIANGWKGLVFKKTGEQYQEWRAKKQAQAQQTPKNATGTRAKPKKDLIAHTKASNAVFRQIKAFEQAQGQFETYPLPQLESLSEQLRDLWREAKSLEIYDSELQRIAGLGQIVTDLIKEKQQVAPKH